MPKTVRLEEAPGGSLQVLTGRRPGEPIGTIAIPTRDHVSAQLFISLMNTSWGFLGDKECVNWSVIQGSMLPTQRNELIQRMQGDWILFIDSDMVFGIDAIQRLIDVRNEHDLDMVGGLCFQRVSPYQPTLYMRERENSGGYAFMERWDTDLVEVDGTGMAFMLIHKRVFERIIQTFDNRPDFTWPDHDERIRVRPPEFFRWVGSVGEDLRFCQDAKASGSRVFVDTRIEIGHVGETIFNRRTFLQELSLRNLETEQARRRLNDRLGLPTMTAEDARAELRDD